MANHPNRRKLYPANIAAHGPARSLDLYLAELVERFRSLRLDDPARGKLAERIRAVEAEIDARNGT